MLKRAKQKSDSESLWLVGYSDLVTAILSVLVLFVSFSKIDIDKFDHIQNLVSNENIETLSQINKKIQLTAQKHNLQELISTKLDDSGLEINFSSVTQFKQSSWVINDKKILKLLPVLEEIIIQSKLRDIEIIGHTDDLEYHERYNGKFGVIQLDNWSLSALRAHSLQQYLAKKGLNVQYSKIIAFADTHPKVTINKLKMNKQELKKARLENRRVSIVIGRLHKKKSLQ
jgi:flagellar motor protein MotB